ncbi:MAG TPA: type II toxin-antitoxin system prevent-host-death family antitoxin [Spirochaetia bacterium]|nr:type II toxin-antitoxin system prevent-host-death family antitoxin [Spirochaetia bacterium]
MIVTRVSEYRSHLSGFHRRVLEDREPLLVSGSNQGDVVVLPADDYELLQETIQILKDKATLNSLLQSRAMVQEGTFEGFDMEDIDRGTQD